MSGIWLFTFFLNLQGEVVEYEAIPQYSFSQCIINKENLEDRGVTLKNIPEGTTVKYECIDSFKGDKL